MPRSKKSAELHPVVRLDGRTLTDAPTFHAVLAKAFGFPKSYGKNLDALVDCLTELDNAAAAMSKVCVPPGHVLTLLLEGTAALQASHRELYDALVETVAFVNARRLERGQGPVLALAFTK